MNGSSRAFKSSSLYQVNDPKRLLIDYGLEYESQSSASDHEDFFSLPLEDLFSLLYFNSYFDEDKAQGDGSGEEEISTRDCCEACNKSIIE